MNLECAIVQLGKDVYMLSHPLPMDIGSARYLGRLSSTNGTVEVHPASDERSLLLILGACLEQFARHCASVSGGAPIGDSVEFLERLHRL